MDEMREIVTMEQVNRLFLLLAVVIPLLGAALGAWQGGKQGRQKQGMMRGFVVGLLGPLNLLLWKVYNLLTDRMGLDTVKNLVVNLVLFVVIGLAAGWLWNNAPRFPGKDGKDDGETDTLSPAEAGAGPTGRGAGNVLTRTEAMEPPRDA